MFKILYAVMRQRMPVDFVDNLEFAPGEYEMMLFETPVLIEVQGEMREYPEHMGILYKPGERVHYKAVEGALVYTWIRFDCDEPLFAEGYVPFGIPISCDKYEYFLKYWEMVANENYWHQQSEPYIVSELMHIIFHWLHDFAYPARESRYQPVLEQLRSEIYAHPEYDWSLDAMAKVANISTRLLQKVYREFAHVSCMADVIESRISHAKMLLIETDFTIEEIGTKCGYHNVEHFCRQFKSEADISPSRYRKLHTGK